MNMALFQLALDNITWTGFAAETISGGMFVKSAAGNDVVTSAGTSSLADGELIVARMDAAADDELVVGFALETVVSGAPITIGTRGMYIVPAQAAVTAGVSVSPSNVADAFCNAVIATADTEEEFKVGKALTGASASGTFLVISLNV